MDTRSIGVFDSGLGGLTVARAISQALPNESIYYVGDTKRCPYGPRSQAEVRTFALEVGRWLEARDVKLMVIACNTATAAALKALQQTLSVPVIGVIEPGARAAVQATRSRKVGVLATEGTVESGSYVRAIHNLDAGVEVVQAPAPRFVEIVERELATGAHLGQDWMSAPEIFDTPEVRSVVAQDVATLVAAGVDTVVLGCTHFPLLARQIRAALNPAQDQDAHLDTGSQPRVRIVSSAEETCAEVAQILRRRDELVAPGAAKLGAAGEPLYRFATTSDDITSFAVAGKFIFGHALDSVEHIELAALEQKA